MTKEILGALLVLFFSFLCLGLCFEKTQSPSKILQLKYNDRADEFVCPPGTEGFFCTEVCTQHYYYCTADGTSYPLDCPSGTVFDPYQPGQPSCASPESAICEDPEATTTTTVLSTEPQTTITSESSTSSTTTETPTTMTTEPTTSSTTTEPSTTTDEPITESTTTSVTVESTTLSTTTRSPYTCGNYSTTNIFTCPESNGEYPYDDCSSLYWQCSNGNAYLNCCPANLVYNPGLKVCDYYYNVAGCNQTIKYAIENENQHETKTKAELNSAKEAASILTCKTDGFFSVGIEKSCSSHYVSCVNGIAYKRMCLGNTLFDPSTRICRKAHLVTC